MRSRTPEGPVGLEAFNKDVTVTLYPEARHEIFNETNRDAITADVIDWLTARS